MSILTKHRVYCCGSAGHWFKGSNQAQCQPAGIKEIEVQEEGCPETYTMTLDVVQCRICLKKYIVGIA
jgi:hypothetical protein